MGSAGAVPLLDWRLQGGVGLIAVALATWLLLRYRERALGFALAASLLEVALLVAVRGLVRPFASLATFWLLSYTLVALPLIAGMAILAWRQWWPSAGFTRPAQWRQFRLLWLLPVFLFLPALSLLVGVRASVTGVILITGYVVIATGMEELFYRGIVLRATVQYGVIPAALISSLLFGASHVNNLFTSQHVNSLFVLEQGWSAALIGIFLAALRLRMNAIWPAIVAHAAADLPGLFVYGSYAFSYRPTAMDFLIVTGEGVFFAAIGLFLLRKAKPSIIPTELKA